MNTKWWALAIIALTFCFSSSLCASAKGTKNADSTVTTTPAFKACMKDLNKDVAAADRSASDHAENVRIAVNVCSHGAAGKPMSVAIRQYEPACESHGFSKQICAGMVSAFLKHQKYRGPGAFAPLDDSSKGAEFSRCMMAVADKKPAPWTAKDEYEMNSGVCSHSAAQNASNAPLLDTEAYCKRVGDVAGGSDEIELTCRQQEHVARNWVSAHATSSRTMKYCARVAEGVGGNAGSYEIMKTCIEQEEQAAEQLGN